MHAFVIAKRDSEFLDSPVFSAGEDGGQEAMAVFTSREQAANYIRQAGWTHDHEVGELRSVQLLRWVLKAHEQGIDMVTVNPDCEAHLEGEPQVTIDLDDPMKMFSTLLRTELIEEVEKRSDETS